MALLKDVEINNTGVTLQYWTIDTLNYDGKANTIHIILHGYLNQKNYEDKKNNLLSCNVKLSQDDLNDKKLDELSIKETYSIIVSKADKAKQDLPPESMHLVDVMHLFGPIDVINLAGAKVIE